MSTNTLEILDNCLERAAGQVNSKRKRVYEKQIQMSGFPIMKTLDDGA